MADCSSEHTVTWFERSTPVALACCFLKACDTAQGGLWTSLGEAGAAMHGVWDTAAVMRRNVLWVPADAPALMGDVHRLRCTPRLAHVGRSSWSVAFELRDAKAGALLARVRTTMVSVDAATHSVAQPLPRPEALRRLVDTSSDTGADQGSGGGSEDATAVATATFTWEERSRLTDCDALGHVNNAVYATLLEEARAVAGRAGAYDGAAAQLLLPPGTAAGAAAAAARELVAAPAAAMAIDYIGQVRPFEALRWSTWLIGACGAVQATFHFRLHVIEGGAARLATTGSISVSLAASRSSRL